VAEGTPKQIESRAESTFGAKSTFGAAIRTQAAEHSLMVVGAQAVALGLIDRSETAARAESKLVRKTGIGWKGWLGAGLGALGGLSAWAASKSKSAAQAKSDLQTASILLDLAVLPIGVELYNVAITGGSRIKDAAEGLGQDSELTTISGLPTRRRMRRGAIRRGAQVARKFIKADNAEDLADLFGLEPDELEALGFEPEEDDDDEPEGLPLFNFVT
jgi:hypothetical protein